MRSVALVSLVLLPAVARATPPPVDQVLTQLEQARTGVQTLAGEFTQRNKVKLFKQEVRSKGRLYFRAPRQIRWEYLEPDPSVLVLDGDRAVLRQPGAEARTFDLQADATMRAVFDQLLLWLQPGGMAGARRDYELSSAGTAAEPVLLLAPKAGSAVAKAFQRIELRVDLRSGLLRSLLLVEKNGDEKEIAFTSLKKNATLPQDAFK